MMLRTITIRNLRSLYSNFGLSILFSFLTFLTPLQASTAASPKIQVHLDLIEKYIQSARYSQSIRQTRKLMESQIDKKTEEKATYLLGKAFLLDEQFQLAQTTFEFLNQQFPDNPYKTSVDFLQINKETAQLSNLSNFEAGLDKLLEFPPFNLDLDFFEFFSGFSKGYELESFSSTSDRLERYFAHEDQELREKAILIHSLILSFDFYSSSHEEGASASLQRMRDLVQNNEKAGRESHFTDLARIALMIREVAKNPEDLNALRAWLPPADAKMSKVQLLSHFLNFLITSYIYGDLGEGLQILTGIRSAILDYAPQVYERHHSVLADLLKAPKNASETLEKAQVLLSYDSYTQALQLYEGLVNRSFGFWVSKSNLGRAYYEMGKLYQDDLKDEAAAKRSFQKAVQYPLLKEFRQEIEWRLLKTQDEDRRRKSVQKLARDNHNYSEAAILEELKRKDLSTGEVDLYYRLLQKMNLTPSAQEEYLEKLSELAQANHQYLKARYYLLKLARFNLKRASELLELNQYRQKIFQASREKLLSLEPERYEFLRAQYFESLGESEIARDIYQSLVSRKSVFAEKSRFALTTMELGSAPYEESVVVELEEKFNSSPDPEIQSRAFDLLLKHSLAFIEDYAHKEEDEKEDLDEFTIPNLKKHLKTALDKGFVNNREYTEKLFKIALLQGDETLARKLLENFDKPGNNTENEILLLKMKLRLEEELQNYSAASQLSRNLAKLEPEHEMEWVSKSFQLSVRQSPDKTSEMETFKSFLKEYPAQTYYPLLKPMVHYAQELAREGALNLILQHSKELTRHQPKGLFQALKTLHRKFPYESELELLRIRLTATQPGIISDQYLVESISATKSNVRREAALALSRKLEGLTPAEVQARLEQHLNLDKQLQQVILENSSFSDEDLYGLCELYYPLVPKARQRSVLEKGVQNSHRFYADFHKLKYIELLLEYKRKKAVLSQLDNLMKNKGTSSKIRYFALKDFHPTLSKWGEVSRMRDWIFDIDRKNLNVQQQQDLKEIAKKVNALNVVRTVKRNIDWDDPQSEKNKREFFELVRIYRDELEDIPATLDLLHQMQQYFTDQSTKAKIQSLKGNLAQIQKALQLQDSKNRVDRLDAAVLWLEKLNSPSRALQVLRDMRKEAKTKAEEDFLRVQEVRCLIDMRMLDRAQEEMTKIDSRYVHFHDSLKSQIDAQKKLQSLPHASKSSFAQLHSRALLYIEEFLDLEKADQVLGRLKTLAKTRLQKEMFCDLMLKYYHVALAKNQADRAKRKLDVARTYTQNAKQDAQVLYLMGNHIQIHQNDPRKAQKYFERAVRISSPSFYRQLSMLNLAQIYEESNQSEKALGLLNELKNSLNQKQGSSSPLSLEEHRLRKSLLISKVNENLQELGEIDPEFVLKAARQLAGQSDYFQEAEKKYRLYLRLQNKKIDPKIYLEMGEFYDNNQKYSSAVEYYRKAFEEIKEQPLRFEAGMNALKVLGRVQRNFKGAFELVSKIRSLLLTPEQSKSLNQLKSQIRDLQKNQKRITLRNLSYSHLPRIQEIKRRYYKNGQYQKAADSLKVLVEQTEDHQLKVGAYYELARVVDLKLEKPKEALKYYEEFFQMMANPEVTSEILLRIAEIHLKELKDHKEAISQYERYVHNFPAARKKLNVLFQLAELYSNYEFEYSMALDTYTDISNGYPQTPWDEKAKLARAELLAQKLSDFNGAIQTYRDLINTNFESSLAPQAQFKIAQIYEIQLNDDLLATQAYDELIARYPNSSYALQARRQLEKIRRR